MEDLRELSKNELNYVNGGIVWVPLVIKGAKVLAAALIGGAGTYVGHEVADGVARGIAGGDYVPCN